MNEERAAIIKKHVKVSPIIRLPSYHATGDIPYQCVISIGEDKVQECIYVVSEMETHLVPHRILMMKVEKELNTIAVKALKASLAVAIKDGHDVVDFMWEGKPVYHTLRDGWKSRDTAAMGAAIGASASSAGSGGSGYPLSSSTYVRTSIE